jgi:hypothetical protein
VIFVLKLKDSPIKYEVESWGMGPKDKNGAYSASRSRYRTDHNPSKLSKNKKEYNE